MHKAVFGAGCFWCVEAIFQHVEGVHRVTSGFSGGHIKNPGYMEVCTGRTGHAEVVQVEFDPAVVSYAELLEIFFQTHNPTELNRQGNDVGTQYRSVIFYMDEEQKEIAEKAKAAADESGNWKKPVVTEISPFEAFYPADQDHQDYYLQHKEQPYCQFVINPKLEKFKSLFREKMKEGANL